jgi:hypothetical protein
MRDALSVHAKKLAAAGKFINMNSKRGERGKATDRREPRQLVLKRLHKSPARTRLGAAFELEKGCGALSSLEELFQIDSHKQKER